MKLIYCPHCYDVRKIQSEKTHCRCGQCWGMYTDDLNAIYGGEAIPLGVANSSFVKAIEQQPTRGLGRVFQAFVIPKICPTYIQQTTTPVQDDFSFRVSSPPRK